MIIGGIEIDRDERGTVGDPKLLKDLMKMHFDRTVRDVPGYCGPLRPSLLKQVQHLRRGRA
jgi:hypothetical protein